MCEQGVFPHPARGWLGWEQQEKAITKEQDQTFAQGFFGTHHPGFLLFPCSSSMPAQHGLLAWIFLPRCFPGIRGRWVNQGLCILPGWTDGIKSFLPGKMQPTSSS